MKRFAILLTAVIGATFAGAGNAEAQQSRQVSQQQAVPVVVPTDANRPKLGVNGYMVNSGYKLTYVAPHSVAQKMGLEAGDIIMRINDVYPRSQRELVIALDEAARSFYRGKIDMRVENVRWHLGQSNQRYVNLQGNLYR